MNSFQNKIKTMTHKAEPPKLEFVKGLAPHNYREFKKNAVLMITWISWRS